MAIRAWAVLPTLCCTVALVLSFLCLFAGSKKGWMEDYAIVTLNTSQIGQDLPLFDDIRDNLSLDRRTAAVTIEEPIPTITSTPDIANAPDLHGRNGVESWAESVYSEGTAGVHSLYTKATAAISVPTQAVAAVDWLKSEGHELTEDLVQEAEHLTNKFENLVEEGLGDFAQVLGIHDFYSAHILAFCEGYYVPASEPNTTLKAGDIHKKVTHCSNKTAMAHFDPVDSISKELNQSTNGFIDLSSVKWPDDIQDALNALKIAQKAVFVLYCLAISFIFLATLTSLMGIFFDGWMSALVNIAFEGLAFLSIMIASALVTFVADRTAHFVNKHGDDIGVSATRGNKFLALTWTTTGLMLLSSVTWTYLLFNAARGGLKRRREMEEKHG